MLAGILSAMGIFLQLPKAFLTAASMGVAAYSKKSPTGF